MPGHRPLLSIEDFVQAARAEQDHGQMEGAYKLWEECRATYPNESAGYLNAAVALLAASRIDEAEALLTDGLKHSAHRLPLMIYHAWSAHHRKDWPVSMGRWHAIAQEFPQAPEGHIGVGLVLLQMNRLDEAENQLSLATAQFPHCEGALSAHADVALARSDFREAKNRLDAALALNPTSAHLMELRGMAVWHIGMEADENNRPSQQSNLAPISQKNLNKTNKINLTEQPTEMNSVELRALFMNFDSLGENCEFGLAQRHFGAEPLGLLRWTSIPLDTLLQLLDAKFVGFAEPGTIELKRPDGREYYLKDNTYGIAFHTFLTQDVEDESAFLLKQTARLRWLRDKMLADLSEGGKTFVYKFPKDDFEVNAFKLFESLSKQGSCRLLCVTSADEEHAPSSVQSHQNGLFFGYLSKLNPINSPEIRWEIPFNEWLEICRQVDAQ